MCVCMYVCVCVCQQLVVIPQIDIDCSRQQVSKTLIFNSNLFKEILVYLFVMKTSNFNEMMLPFCRITSCV